MSAQEDAVEAVARAIYDANNPSKHAVEFEVLHPFTQKMMRRRARAAISAYKAMDKGRDEVIEECAKVASDAQTDLGDELSWNEAAREIAHRILNLKSPPIGEK